jgi:hypothetical protein
MSVDLPDDLGYHGYSLTLTSSPFGMIVKFSG